MTDEIPPGWRATEYTDGRGNVAMRDPESGAWEAFLFDDNLGGMRSIGEFPTAAAAICALEQQESKNG